MFIFKLLGLIGYLILLVPILGSCVVSTYILIKVEDSIPLNDLEAFGVFLSILLLHASITSVL